MKKILLILLTSIHVFASSAFINSETLQKMTADKHLMLFDITDKETYLKGHIPHAIHVNVGDFRQQVGKYQLIKSPEDVEALLQGLGLKNDSKVVIYGHGKPKELIKSSYLAMTLIAHGIKEVSLLNGGFNEWKEDYSDLISSKNVVTSKSDFKAIFDSNILVDLAYMKESIGKKDMIESRPPRYYYGKDQSAGVKRLGHIPTAKTSFWKNNFYADGMILDDKELDACLIDKNKLKKDKEVIIYCTGGLEASMNWFILSQHYQFDTVKIYDASMREWGNREDTPLTVE